MSDQTVFVIACTEEDIRPVHYPQPRFAKDGSCAHRDIDPFERCRMCFVAMGEVEYEHRAIAWEDALPLGHGKSIV